MTRVEAANWLYLAGCALGESERYWFGSLYDLGRDMRDVLLKHGPGRLVDTAMTFAPGPKGGPKLRALCLFARRIAREVK